MFEMRHLCGTPLMLCWVKVSPLSCPEQFFFSRQHLCQYDRPQEAGEDVQFVCECGWRTCIMREREREREREYEVCACTQSVKCVCVCTLCLASMHMPYNALHIHVHVHVSLTDTNVLD